MTSRWDRTWELFHAATELPETERNAYLESACEGDPDLVAEVESLLQSHKSCRYLARLLPSIYKHWSALGLSPDNARVRRFAS